MRNFTALYRRIKMLIYAHFNPQKLAAILYENAYGGRQIDFQHPKDLDEKINWLKFNTDTNEWAKLADKYLVRNFVQERVGEKYLIPLLGVWDSANDINFNDLPMSFVLKSNNGAGNVLIIHNKQNIEEKTIRKKCASWLKQKFGLYTAEPHYLKIKPMILAEAMLYESTNKISSSLIDYKIWCFNGEVFGTWCCYNRDGFHADVEWHDLDWTFRPEWSVFTDSYRNGGGNIPKPINYEEMLDVASKLSFGFPEVRIDLYNIEGKVYFGEMTFTSAAGHNNFYSDKVLLAMGEKVKI